MELAVKLEAALVKYLQTLDPSPWLAYFTAAGATPQVKPGENDEDIDRQYIRCRAALEAIGELPLDTGNFFWPVEIEVRTPVREQTAAETASDDTGESTEQLAKHRALAQIVEDAVLVDNLDTLLTAAAAALGAGYELTIMRVTDRKPGHGQSDDVYSSGWQFQLYCCSKAFA